MHLQTAPIQHPTCHARHFKWLHMLSLCLTLLCFTQASQAQFTSDKEYTWATYSACLGPVVEEIFVVVETPPVLLMSQHDFEKAMERVIQQLALPSDLTCQLKLKILFMRNDGLCLYKLGQSAPVLSDQQIEVLQNMISDLGDMEPGKQRNVDKHCQGIVYLEIRKGAVKKLLTRNFNFN